MSFASGNLGWVKKVLENPFPVKGSKNPREYSYTLLLIIST
jgi:hypothetical protein